MNYSPFPYKLTKDGSLKNGSLFPIPNFCLKHCISKECSEHYNKVLKNVDGFVKCPYGFATDIIKIGDQQLILTCLNLEKITSRKVERLLSDKDFLPRLSLERYNRIIEDYKMLISENTYSNEQAIELARQSDSVNNQKVLLENTLHEIRKLNNQLKNSVDIFLSETNKARYDWDKIKDVCKDICSIASLMSIRFDYYDFEVNPTLNTNAIEIPIPIYKRIEKIYKCLTGRIAKKGLRVILDGKSYNLYNASSILEIALFIIIDNAVKYALEKTDIRIKFKEVGNKLTVTFYNWGICPERSEQSLLTERGYRSKKIVESQKYEGRGIGLFILKTICQIVGVKLHLTIGTENKYYDGYRFSQFIVELRFDNMIIPNEEF